MKKCKWMDINNRGIKLVHWHFEEDYECFIIEFEDGEEYAFDEDGIAIKSEAKGGNLRLVEESSEGRTFE